MHRHEGKSTSRSAEEARYDSRNQRLLLYLILEVVRDIASLQVPCLSANFHSLYEVEQDIMNALSCDKC